MLCDGEPAKKVLVASLFALVPAIETNLPNLVDFGMKVCLAVAFGERRIVSLSLDYTLMGLWLIVASLESMLGRLAKS